MTGGAATTGDRSERGRGGGAGRALAAAAPPILAFVALLGLWQAVALLGLVPPDMLPAPTRIAEAGAAEGAALLGNALPTLTATLLGFALSVAVAFAAAILLDFSALLRRALLPILIVSQTLPLIALAPLVVLWFGFGLLPKVLLVAFVTFFPMVVGLLRGFDAADAEAERLLRTMGAGRRQVFRLIRLPSAIPSFFSSLRISITYAVVGTIFAEYAGAVAGLGVYMQQAKHVFRTDLVLAAVTLSSLLTLALFGFVVLLERTLFPWLRAGSGSGADAVGAAERAMADLPAAGPESAEPGRVSGDLEVPKLPAPARRGAALEVLGVTRGFGGRPVLRDVSLSVGAGEVVAIVGASGSGKSTLLSLLTGTLAAETGEVRYGGARIGAGPQERPFACMPQRDALLPWRRALDNAAIGLEVAGAGRPEARARAAQLFAPFGLDGAEAAYPGELSGGMRQRVSFLRTVVQGRPVLLLDEPFGALDAITRDELQRWLIRIQAVHGWTIVMITHDIREAIRLSDRVLVLGGTPSRIFGGADIPRDLARLDGFSADPRVPILERDLTGLLSGRAKLPRPA